MIALIARCFGPYPGCVLDVDGEEPQLRTPGDSFESCWIAELDGRVVGCIACHSHKLDDGTGALELKKLYIDANARGMGLARRLIDLVEDRAHEVGARVIDLWTDTRFTKAHAVYEHYGFVREAAERELGDLSETREYYFTKAMPKTA